MRSHFSSEASFARQWTMQVLQTLQTGTSVLFFSGCVCTLGPPVLPSLEEMDHSRLEPKESGTTVCPSPAHCRGNPGRDGCQHHPQPRPAHRKAGLTERQLPSLSLLPRAGRGLQNGKRLAPGCQL